MADMEQSGTNGSLAADLAAKSTGEMRHLVRQPVFDERSRLQGYELLFRLYAEGPAGSYGNHATRAILDDIVLYGLDQLTGGAPVFLTCSAESITELFVTVLQPGQAILCIPEQLEFYPRMISSCRKLKEAGYSLALENFRWGPLPHVLLPSVDFIKMDPTTFSDADMDRLQGVLAGTTTALVAENVHTREGFQLARDRGFTYFQGFYFCQPESIKRNKVQGNKLLHVDLLQQLRSDPLDLKKVTPLVKRDMGLVYRLLKLVNSPLCAIRQEVQSVELAILVLGEKTFRRIAMLAVLSELNTGQPAEILHTTLVRARFCEIAAKVAGCDPGEQYLLGMLSLLPAMLCQPMQDLVKDLPLRAEIAKSLEGEENHERCLLSWIEAHERNEPIRRMAISQKHGLNDQKLEQFYVDALMWEAMTTRSMRG